MTRSATVKFLQAAVSPRNIHIGANTFGDTSFYSCAREAKRRMGQGAVSRAMRNSLSDGRGRLGAWVFRA